ncbi:dipeptidase PepE [Altibacter sp. HG106]|uniref:dipeptidase PepE n=1 Tax=Altibacter sp. HG106 TaxID=3023937 RepID=UPI0023502792|nr:dipeptidase PepE [Altibacter sp. HG106]MDC7995884.1 dipeptidase PepE [Altibacter sp. HG106]
MKNLLLASTSTLYKGAYLEYLMTALKELYSEAETICFVPYARPGGISFDEYTKNVSEAFQQIDKNVNGIHTFEDPEEAIVTAEALFVGGGNTFVLLNSLYQLNLLPLLRDRIFEGLPYLGTSAGSNLCGITMQTTNDMPIVYPPSFKTLGAVPFNINPHYLDPPTHSEHMGETRETRIREFHTYHNIPVVGLREGSWLRVKDEDITLHGVPKARIFEQGKAAVEIESGTKIDYL